jgi:hypothetical protein
MSNDPRWLSLKDSEKLEYLREWCDRLTRGVEEQRAVTQSLHERLQRVERKLETS